jgi:hypothetical protein
MQASLMGSLQPGQGMIPISARLKGAAECVVVGMMLPLRWAGALLISQSPMDADGGAVMDHLAATQYRRAGQYCSQSKT